MENNCQRVSTKNLTLPMIEDEINLLDYWRVIVRWRKTIILIVVLITLSSALFSLFLPRIYQAKTTIMPLSAQQGTGLSQLISSGAGGGFNLFGDFTARSSSPRLLALLKSQTLAEKVISKHNLMKALYPDLWDNENQKWKTNDTQKIPTVENGANNLLGQLSFTEHRETQLIEVKAEMRDPKLAAEVINNYAKELAEYINKNTFTATKRNRIFIGGQLERNRAEFLKSGKELSDFYTVNKISNIAPTVDVDISFDTSSRQALPEITDVQKKTEELQKKVEEMEVQVQKAKILKGIPQQVYLEYLTSRHRFLVEISAILARQYELAKIEEAKEDLAFEVIDRARVPEKWVKPKRRQIVMMAFAMSAFLAIFYAFFREYLEKIKVRRS